MTTTLDVLNQMLHVMGEQPVSSPTSTHPSAISAFVTLNRVARQFQTRGWWFNREIDLPLLPQSDTGFIIIPDGTIDIDPVDPNSRLVQRGNKLYDPVNHTYNIGQTVLVDCIIQLPIEELPEVAVNYLIAKAKHDVYVDDDGDETKSTQLARDVVFAWALLQQAELRNTDVNSNQRPLTARLLARSIQWHSSGNPNLIGGGR